MDETVAQLGAASTLTGAELLYVVQTQSGSPADARSTVGAVRDFTMAALLAAMQSAGVLSSAQVSAINTALTGGGSIVAPIAGDGVLDFSNPGTPLSTVL